MRSSTGAATRAVRSDIERKPANSAAKASERPRANGRARETHASAANSAVMSAGSQRTGSRSAARLSATPPIAATGIQRKKRRSSTSRASAPENAPRQSGAHAAARVKSGGGRQNASARGCGHGGPDKHGRGAEERARPGRNGAAIDARTWRGSPPLRGCVAQERGRRPRLKAATRDIASASRRTWRESGLLKVERSPKPRRAQWSSTGRRDEARPSAARRIRALMRY